MKSVIFRNPMSSTFNNLGNLRTEPSPEISNFSKFSKREPLRQGDLESHFRRELFRESSREPQFETVQVSHGIRYRPIKYLSDSAYYLVFGVDFSEAIGADNFSYQMEACNKNFFIELGQ